MAGYVREADPLVLREAGDRDPAVPASAAIDAVRRRRLVGRSIAGPRRGAPVGRPVQHRRATEEESSLRLRRIDTLTLARALTMVQRGEDGQREAVGT